MAKIEDLPTELVSCVAEYLQVGDLANFARTATKFYHVADPVLYKLARDVYCDPAWDPAGHDRNPLRWAAENGMTGIIRKCVAAGFSVDMQFVQHSSIRERDILCFQRRVEALESEETWEKETPFGKAPPDREGTADPLHEDSRGLPVNFEPEDALLWDTRRVRRNFTTTRDKCQRTVRALHLAVIGGHDEAVGVLLDHGAEIDATCMNACDCPFYSRLPHLETGYSASPGTAAAATTSLHLAICHFRVSTAELLLRRGASIQMPETHLTGLLVTYSATALHTAAATGQANLCKYLLDKDYVQDVDILDPSGLTPLYWAYYNGHWKTTVSALLEREANIDFGLRLDGPEDATHPPNPGDSLDDPIFTTLLYEACQYGWFEEAQKLIRLGADVNKGRCSEGTVIHTPLHAACNFLPRHCRPPFSPPIQLSKITYGGEDSRRQLIQVLLQEGADIDAVSHDGLGYTPLYEAASDHLVAAVETLLTAGADVNFQTYDRSTPLLIACWCFPRHKHDRYFRRDRYLSKCGPDTISSDRYDTVKLLLDHGSKVTMTQDGGYTALHNLCRKRRIGPKSVSPIDEIRVLRLLLDRGADESARDSHGRTAFQEAFLHRDLDSCNIFLRYRKVARPLTFEEVDEMMAAGVGSAEGMEIFEMLLDLDTDNHLASTSKFIMKMCREYKDTAVYAYLQMKPPLLNAAEKGNILHLAIRNQNMRLFKHMLTLKAPVNRIVEGGLPPFVAAVVTMHDTRMLTMVTKDLLAAGGSIHFRDNRSPQATPLQEAINRAKTPVVKLMLRHRPLRDDPAAPKGVYLHAAAALGPRGREIVDVLLGAGAALTELDAGGDTPLGAFLRDMTRLGDAHFLLSPFKPDKRAVADQVCAVVQHLWAEDVDIRARNKADKSVVGYLTALCLYEGDNETRVRVARRLRRRVKVVPAAGGTRPEHLTLEFLSLSEVHDTSLDEDDMELDAGKEESGESGPDDSHGSIDFLSS